MLNTALKVIFITIFKRLFMTPNYNYPNTEYKPWLHARRWM